MDYVSFSTAQKVYRYPALFSNGTLGNLVADLINVYNQGVEVCGFHAPTFILHSKHSEVLTRVHKSLSCEMEKVHPSVKVRQADPNFMDRPIEDSSYLVYLDYFVDYPLALHSVGDVLNNRSVGECCEDVVRDFMGTEKGTLCVFSKDERLGYFVAERMNLMLKKGDPSRGAFFTAEPSGVNGRSYLFDADSFFTLQED